MTINDYIEAVEANLATGAATEHTHRAALQQLVEALRPAVAAVNEPKREACGAPDYSVKRDGLTIGYIETKDVGVTLDDVLDSEQLKRYRGSLDNLLLTNYLDFRWLVDGEPRGSAALGSLGAGGKIECGRDGKTAVVELLAQFLEHQPQPVATPTELANRLARLTHAVRDVIVDAFSRNLASDLLADLRDSFAKSLLPDIDQPGKAGEFADMYAQTLAYGLFAARCNHSGQPGSFKRLGAVAEIPKTNPFLRRLFETITGTALDDEPYAGFVDDIVQLLAYADMGAILAEFGRRIRQEDPIVHFYETFLSTYDPRLREKRGVYYTPEPVVSYIVRSVDQLLQTRFQLAGGLADTAAAKWKHRVGKGEEKQVASPRVLILDPACGTGTFLYAVIDIIREQFKEQGNAGMWSGYVKEQLLPRLFGFELLMAPYAVAHLKLGMQLAGQDLTEEQRRTWAYDFSGNERLNIYLTNTLDRAEREIETLYGPLRVITEEANAAAAIKHEMPILVVMGNPPYSGHSANSSWETNNGKRQLTFIGDLVQDYYQADGEPLGERNPKWLQDDYVKFIRWGQWRIEQTGAGILAFITNHGYLDNPTFRGMRQQLLNTFSDIYILDLHGNTKKKEIAPGGIKDENVFDIQQGTAIGIFVKQPGHTDSANVHHAELWGRQTKKYDWLNKHDITNTRWKKPKPSRPFYLFKPQNMKRRAEYQRAQKVTDIFGLAGHGIKSSRDHFAIAFSKEELIARLREFTSPSVSDDEIARKYKLHDTGTWKLSDARKLLMKEKAPADFIVPINYRPFDFRFCIWHRAMMERPRLQSQRHVVGYENIALGTTRSVEIGRGFEHAFCTSLAMDGHMVSIKETNYIFPLYLYPDPRTNGDLFTNGCRRHNNLEPAFVGELEEKLKLKFIPDGSGNLESSFGPEDVFNYIYAILNSQSYRERYAEFLKDDFPRVPFTDDRRLFAKLCKHGAKLAALHMLKAGELTQGRTTFPETGDNIVAKNYPKYYAPGEAAPGSNQPLAEGRVNINRTQYFDNVPEEAWDFYIGGYHVCEKWLKDRRQRQLTFADIEHYRKTIQSIIETLDIIAAIDDAIPGLPLP